jgi:hypothetical protein
MAVEETKDLIKFLNPYPEHVRQLFFWLRELTWKLYPGSNELIYDNYNAVVTGFSTSDRLGDTFCSVAAGTTAYVHFGFYWGSKLTDPDKILLGNGKQYRYIKVGNKNDFPEAAIKKLVKEARANSLAGLINGKQTVKGKTITKSISPSKRRPK